MAGAVGSVLLGRIVAGELYAARGQPIGVSRRPSPLRGRLPFRFEMALLFQADQQGVESAGFDIGSSGQLVAVTPCRTAGQEGSEDPLGVSRECA